MVQVLSCEFCEISKNAFFIEHLWWLLLDDGEKFRAKNNLPITDHGFV